MSEQKITLKIGSHAYSMTVQSPEDEARLRKAAARVSARIDWYAQHFPDRTAAEVLPFIALNETNSALKLQEELQKAAAASDSLHAKVEDYLKNIEI